MSGDGQVFGSDAHLEAARAPGEEGSATVTATLEQAARVKRGVNFGWLTGPLPLTLKAPLSRASADVEVDLTPAGVDNPIPGVAKAAGKPGKASFAIKPSPERRDGPAPSPSTSARCSLRGSAEVGVDGAIQTAKFTQARLSPGDSLQADVVNTASTIKATVHGTAFDARPVPQGVDRRRGRRLRRARRTSTST